MQDLRTRREFAEPQAAWPGPIAPAALAVTFVAEVLALDAPHGFVLDAGAGKCIGHCAAGCLLVPEVGDQVACWYGAAPHHAPAQAYIVSVLVRADPARQATLALHGDTLIDCRAGTLTLKATTAIAVETPRCAVHADELSLQAHGPPAWWCRPGPASPAIARPRSASSGWSAKRCPRCSSGRPTTRSIAGVRSTAWTNSKRRSSNTKHTTCCTCTARTCSSTATG